MVREEAEFVRWFLVVLEAFALKLTIDDASFWRVGASACSTAFLVPGHLPIGRSDRGTRADGNGIARLCKRTASTRPHALRVESCIDLHTSPTPGVWDNKGLRKMHGVACQ